MSTLLKRMADARLARREALRLKTRARLELALRQVLPGHRVLIYGSITLPHRFREDSDVDIALETEPEGMSIFGLAGTLEERLGRPVDVVLLDRCRFRKKIEREAELWTS
jgi:predicted nucleotidyltransferase